MSMHISETNYQEGAIRHTSKTNYQEGAIRHIFLRTQSPEIGTHSFLQRTLQILLTLVAVHSHLDRNIYLHLQARLQVAITIMTSLSKSISYILSPPLWTRDRRYNCILKIH